jgi:tetratricopeptide (TPR) repeat protein
MFPYWTQTFTDRAILIFAHGLVGVMQFVLLLQELVAPTQKKGELRAMREEANRLRRENHLLIKQVEQDPCGFVAALDEYVARIGDPQMQQRWSVHRFDLRAIQQESEELERIGSSGDGDAAKQADGYRSYIGSHPDSRLAHQCLGNALREVRDWDGSLIAYRELLRLSGDSDFMAQSARIQIAQVLRERGDVDAAVAEFRALIAGTTRESRTLLPVIYLYLGNALCEAGDRRGARAAWKQAVSKDRKGAVGGEARKLLQETR